MVYSVVCLGTHLNQVVCVLGILSSVSWNSRKSGVPNQIKKLAREDLRATLAVSIHAPTQELRQKIVPSAKAYPLEALMEVGWQEGGQVLFLPKEDLSLGLKLF